VLKNNLNYFPQYNLQGDPKKDKLTAGEEDALGDASKSRFQLTNDEFDPNEPVYCTCKYVTIIIIVVVFIVAVVVVLYYVVCECVLCDCVLCDC
jgi:hypothetical protein